MGPSTDRLALSDKSNQKVIKLNRSMYTEYICFAYYQFAFVGTTWCHELEDLSTSDDK